MEKKETRGRHKKNCICEKCLKKYPERKEILEEKQEKSVFEYEAPAQEAPAQETPAQETPAQENITVKSFETVESMLSEYNDSATVEIETPGDIETQNVTNETKYIIKGKMLLFLIDSVLPFGIVMLYNKIKGKKIDAKDIRLTTDEKDELEHLADEVAKTIGGTGSPLMTLTVSMALIYTMNLIAIEE